MSYDPEELERCSEAIRAFYRAFAIAQGFTHDHYDPEVEKKLHPEFGDQYYLIDYEDFDGLRYGGPGWGHLKLCYDRMSETFSLDPNGMDETEFLAFQDIVAAEFEAAGLTFELRT